MVTLSKYHQIAKELFVFFIILQTLLISNHDTGAEPSQTAEDVSSQPIMKIQSTNYQVDRVVSVYPWELKMLIMSLQHFVLKTAIFSSFAVPVKWISLT